MKRFVTIVLRGLVSLSKDKSCGKERVRHVKRERRRARTTAKWRKVMLLFGLQGRSGHDATIYHGVIRGGM